MPDCQGVNRPGGGIPYGCNSLLRGLILVIFFGLATVLLFSGILRASTNIGGAVRMCDQAAQAAARSQGVPLDVLKAVTRIETGRQGKFGLQPWPWTVNMEGEGRWFATKEEALAYVFEAFEQGARSFDVGCFQINYKWHNGAFRSIDEMFEPLSNALYAAKFLKQLYSEFGNWPDAAGAYHSRTPAKAKFYASRFAKVRGEIAPQRQLASLPGVGETAWEFPNQIPSGPSNPSPFFGPGSTALGSLVPLVDRRAGGKRVFVALN
jgi:Transglycosylase SLT domain